MKRKKPALEELVEGRKDYLGYCISCFSIRECCEPDAREYECKECGKNSVYGCEELIVMG